MGGSHFPHLLCTHSSSDGQLAECHSGSSLQEDGVDELGSLSMKLLLLLWLLPDAVGLHRLPWSLSQADDWEREGSWSRWRAAIDCLAVCLVALDGWFLTTLGRMGKELSGASEDDELDRLICNTFCGALSLLGASAFLAALSIGGMKEIGASHLLQIESSSDGHSKSQNRHPSPSHCLQMGLGGR